MGRHTHWVLGALVLSLFARPDCGSSQLRLVGEAFLGGAVNAPTSLTLRQDGQPDIELTAHYDTRGFEEPLYWSVRLALMDERRAFELQLTHHKLYLSNPPVEVQRFEITHGFNTLTLAYTHRSLPVELRAGAGIVLAKPEGTVRGRRFATVEPGLAGYHLTGPALLAGIGKRFEVVRHLLVTLESDVSAAWANGLSVIDGSFDASNVAVHFRFGLGYAF